VLIIRAFQIIMHTCLVLRALRVAAAALRAQRPLAAAKKHVQSKLNCSREDRGGQWAWKKNKESPSDNLAHSTSPPPRRVPATIVIADHSKEKIRQTHPHRLHAQTPHPPQLSPQTPHYLTSILRQLLVLRSSRVTSEIPPLALKAPSARTTLLKTRSSPAIAGRAGSP